MNYPKYYRKAGRCVKVISALESRTIILPPAVPAAERFSDRYPTADRLQEDIKDFQEVTEQMWKDFLFTFYATVSDERTEQHKRVREELMALTKPKQQVA